MLLSGAWSTRAHSDGVSTVSSTFALLAQTEQVCIFFFLQVIYLREIKTNLVYSKTYIPWWKHQTADTGAELKKKKKLAER